MRCSNHANEVAHRIPNSAIFEEFGIVEFCFGKVVELRFELLFQTTPKIHPHSALAGNIVCLNRNSHCLENEVKGERKGGRLPPLSVT